MQQGWAVSSQFVSNGFCLVDSSERKEAINISHRPGLCALCTLC